MSDPRITRGLERQLELRSSMLADGNEPLGWKAAFGAPASMKDLELTGPIVGFMTSATVLEDGATVDISSWTRPVAEPELAVWLGNDLTGSEGDDQIRNAITALGPAIEVADVEVPPTEVEEVLACDVFHRGVLFGESDRNRRGADLSGLQAEVRIGGEPVDVSPDLESMTGRIPDVLRRLATLVFEQGERIRAGEVVICGSLTPPLSLTPPTTVEFTLSSFQTIAVDIR